MKFNILIVEDELLIAEMLKEMLLELDYHVVAIARSYETAIQQLKNRSMIDFAIVDINLNEEKTGMDVALALKEIYRIPFIFLTSYSDKKTLEQAITHRPEAYLIKPFSKPDLYTTLEIISARKADREGTFVFKDGGMSIKLNLSDILWLKSENIYVEIKTKEKTYTVRNSLEKLLHELNSEIFLRIHRSYAVNIHHVKAVNGLYVIIDGERIPLSRKVRDDLMARFMK